MMKIVWVKSKSSVQNLYNGNLLK